MRMAMNLCAVQGSKTLTQLRQEQQDIKSLEADERSWKNRMQ